MTKRDSAREDLRATSTRSRRATSYPVAEDVLPQQDLRSGRYRLTFARSLDELRAVVGQVKVIAKKDAFRSGAGCGNVRHPLQDFFLISLESGDVINRVNDRLHLLDLPRRNEDWRIGQQVRVGLLQTRKRSGRAEMSLERLPQGALVNADAMTAAI